MATTFTTDRTAELERKVDRLTEQVAFLVAEAEAARRRREGWEELQATAMPIATSVLEAASSQLDETGLSGERLVALLRRLAANVDTLEAAVAQLESLAELAEILSPIAGQAMDLATDRLQALDERGYFSFAKAGLGVVDRVVTGFSEEDVEQLGDNVILILDTVKEMTQPEIMAVVYRMIERVRQQREALEHEPEKAPSLWGLLRQMRDPEVRRGIRRALMTLKAVSDVDVRPPEIAGAGTGGSPMPRERENTTRGGV